MSSGFDSATNHGSPHISIGTSSLSPKVDYILHRKSISSFTSKTRHSIDCEPSTTGASLSTCSPLVSSLNPGSPVRRKKFSLESQRKLRRQRSADEIHVRGLWPSTKKSGVSPRKVTLQDHLNDDCYQTWSGSRKLKIEDKQHGLTANFAASSFSSLQRLNFDSATFEDNERGNRGRSSSKENRTMRNYSGKFLIERSSAKPGMPLSASSSLLSGSEHLPSHSDAIFDGRLSPNNSALEQRRSEFSIDFLSIQTESSEARSRCSPPNSRAPIKITVRRVGSPVRNSRSPVLRKSSRSPVLRTSSSQALRTPKSPLSRTSKSNSPVQRRSGSPSRRCGSPASTLSVTPQESKEESMKSLKSCRQRSSPAKGRRGGSVGSLISMGLSSLFGRNSFSGITETSNKQTPSAATLVAAIGSPAREASVGFGSLARGSAAGEWLHRLRMANNYLIQWRFLNARAGAVGTVKRATAVNTLMSAWYGLSELGIVVSQKRLHLAKLRLSIKLVNLLFPQLNALEIWKSMEIKHIKALSSTKDCLHAAVCRLPITERAKADPQLLSILLRRATNLAIAIEEDVATCNSITQGLVPLLDELAKIVAREKPLLEESLNLLGCFFAVQFQEESLRCHLIQLKS
ncbi:hypothetical protein HPP92_017061 [Vanilla planifolia]|uniref:QWRF motif-containing protein 2-like n=1 Tax=Vanilla planifolia TaxID=51239 RepID=A0A835QLD4_VANPL|nr:hypothetical protein HPP92_017061 [Vanilla planifolia]